MSLSFSSKYVIFIIDLSSLSQEGLFIDCDFQLNIIQFNKSSFGGDFGYSGLDLSFNASNFND